MITPIQNAVAAYYAITVDELISGGKNQALVTARQIARYLEREAGGSYPEIGKLYGNDHTTVMASFNHVKERLTANDARYVEPVRALLAVLQMTEDKRAQAESEAYAYREFQAMACPTCGAPVIAELKRQIAVLRAEVEKVKR